MSRVKAPTVQVGALTLDVEWRDTGYDRGIAVNIEVTTGTTRLASVAKLDAFERQPHWHQTRPGTYDAVEPMDLADPLGDVFELLSILPELLRTAGHGPVADLLDDDQIGEIVTLVKEAIDSVHP